MVSFVGLFTRKPGMSRDAYIHRYENGHAKFAMPLTPMMCDYRRSYIVPGSMTVIPRSRDASPPSFDSITEIDFESQEKLDELNRVLAETDAGERIAADEEQQFDRSKIILFLTDQCDGPADQLAPRPGGVKGEPPVKLMGFVSKPAELNRTAFIDRYENEHAVLATRLLRQDGRPVIAGYKRAYPVEGSPMELPHCPRGASLDFDALTSLFFWSEPDMHAFLEVCGNPTKAGVSPEDAAKIFGRETTRMLRVQECVTPHEVIAEKYAAYAAAVTR